MPPPWPGHRAAALAGSSGTASTSERATTPKGLHPPGVVTRTGPVRSTGPVSGADGHPGVSWRGRTRPPTHEGTPGTLPALWTRYGLHQPRRTRRNAQEWRAIETVLSPPGDGATLWPSWSPLVRSAEFAAARLANVGHLGRSATFRSILHAYQRLIPRLAKAALGGRRAARATAGMLSCAAKQVTRPGQESRSAAPRAAANVTAMDVTSYAGFLPHDDPSAAGQAHPYTSFIARGRSSNGRSEHEANAQEEAMPKRRRQHTNVTTQLTQRG
jgi:hypothetical protein